MRVLGGIVAMAAIVALAGCTAPATRPSPAPSVAAAAAPVFSGADGCAGILALPDVELAASTSVIVQRDERSTPLSSGDIALAQAGGISCVWGQGTTSAGSGDRVTLDVLPDPGRKVDSEGLGSSEGQDSFEGQGGGSPVCQVDGGTTCSSDTWVKGWWVSASLAAARTGDTVDAATARFGTLLTLVGSHLADAPTSVVWPSAGRAYRDPALCSAAGTRTLGRALRVPSLAVQTVPRSGIVAAALTAAGGLSCQYTDQSVALALVPGATWAFARLDGDPHPSSDLIVFRRATVKGVSDAYVRCDHFCTALMLYRGSAIELSGTAASTAAFVRSLERYAATLH